MNGSTTNQFETIIWIVLICTGVFVFNYIYKKSSYYLITHKSYLRMRFNLGSYGEYLIFKHLKSLERNGSKMLFNCYIPKGNNETTEADVILITEYGIFVFESKNYSGWIFGNDTSKTWTQTLPQGKGKSHKEHFLNPIFQNALHINSLKALLANNNIPIFSIIAFSDRCTFKKLEMHNRDAYVIHRKDSLNTVTKIILSLEKALDNEKINEIYNVLLPYTQVDEQVKVKHIENINSKKYK